MGRGFGLDITARVTDERAWMVDMNRRIVPQTMRGTALLFLGAIVAAPWLPAATYLPAALAGISFGIGQYIAIRRQVLAPMVYAWFVCVFFMVVTIAVSHTVLTGGVVVLFFPLSGACAGFPSRLVRACVAYMAALAIGAGALTYHSSPVRNPAMLIMFVMALVGVAAVTEASRQAMWDDRAAAVRDALTGLLNRGALERRARELHDESLTQLGPVGVVIADVDDFKLINDQHGHQRGDAVLRDLAERLRSSVRSYDQCFRLGGEEFLILLPGADVDASRKVAEKLRELVRSTPIAGVPITLSLGVAASPVGSAFRYEEMLALADSALYEAKRDGRDRTVVAA
jgi:diguanylate cyclase (GGDEF)-like protein